MEALEPGGGSIQKGQLYILDSNLSSLAVDAALELDQIQNGKDTKLVALRELTSLIEDSVDTTPSTPARAIMDVSTAIVMQDAIVGSKLFDSAPSTTEELARMASKLSSGLRKQLDPSEHNGEIADLKRFCLLLAHCARVYRESVFPSPQYSYPSKY